VDKQGEILFEALEPRLLLSGAVLSEPFSSASQIALPPAGTRQVTDYCFDTHAGQMYRFITPADGQIQIHMRAWDDGLDPQLELYNDRGRRIGRNNDASRDTTDSVLRRSVRAGQTYYVLAGSANGGQGLYDLRITSRPRDDFVNTTAAAEQRRLRRDGSGQINGRINYASDEDVVRLVATQTGLMRIEVSAPGRSNDLQGSISAYDESDSLLTTGGDELRFDVVEGRTYFLKMAAEAETAGRYRIRIRPTLSSFLADAAPLEPPTPGSAELTDVLASGQAAAYTFTATARGHYSIRMTADGDGVDPYLEMFNEDGRRRARNDNRSRDTQDSRLRRNLRAGQTYYVVASNLGAAGEYTLEITSDPIDDRANTFVEAYHVRTNRRGLARREGRIQYATDLDVFTFVARRTGRFRAELTAPGRRNELDATLAAHDSDGNLLARSEGQQEDLVSFTVIAGQRYFITAGAEDGSTGRYRIQFAQQPMDIPVELALQQTPEAGEKVRTEIVSLASGRQLFVIGTTASDDIRLSCSGGTIVVESGDELQRVTGPLSGIAVYGFDGADTITLAHSIDLPHWVFAGAGEDSIFAAATGAGGLYGESGDDLIVSIGGGADTLVGDQGLDSFWTDADDSIVDSSAMERAAAAVHQVQQFYQPYTSRASARDYVPLELAGQNLRDPTLSAYAARYADFAHLPVFVDGPDYNDAAQGALGDCYFLAGLSSLADADPQLLEQMVAPLGDGTYAVRFYRQGRPVYLRLDADLPVTSNGGLAYAQVSCDGEMWVPLVEKAFAYFRYDANSYDSLNMGWMSEAYDAVANAPTASWSTHGSTQALFDSVSAALEDGHAVAAGSIQGASSPIVSTHAYQIRSVESAEDGDFVTLYNPWGVDGRYWDDNPYDGLLTLSMEDFQDAFAAVAVSLA